MPVIFPFNPISNVIFSKSKQPNNPLKRHYMLLTDDFTVLTMEGERSIGKDQERGTIAGCWIDLGRVLSLSSTLIFCYNHL